MKEIMKKGATLFGYLLVAGLMCIITYISFKMIFNMALTHEIGYQVYGTVEGSTESEYLYTFEYTDEAPTSDDDTKWAEYEKQGYTLKKSSIKSKLSGGGYVTMALVSQIFCLMFTGSFVVEILLKVGNKDGILIRSGSKKLDKYKGLKITLFACIPSLLSYIILLICYFGVNKGLYVELYMLANATYWPLLDLIVGSAHTINELSFWQFVLMFIIQCIIPFIGFMAYFVGYKDYSFLSKLVYKKKKG